MSREFTCITCTCGAEYAREEARLPIRDVGIQECDHCGVVLERWQGRVVPVYRLVRLPGAKNASAA